MRPGRSGIEVSGVSGGSYSRAHDAPVVIILVKPSQLMMCLSVGAEQPLHAAAVGSSALVACWRSNR